MTLRVKNWSKHQHFKDRTPPWIKLYRDILDDPDWHALDGDVAKLLIGIWLIASEDETHEGRLPDERRLAFRLRVKESFLKQALTKLSNWLISDDIEAISSRYRRDTPETERETEREKETEKEIEVRDIALYPPEVPESLWVDFLKLRKAKKAPWNQTALDGFRREAATAGYTLEQAIRTTCERGWQGFKAEWVMGKNTPKQTPTKPWMPPEMRSTEKLVSAEVLQ